MRGDLRGGGATEAEVGTGGQDIRDISPSGGAEGELQRADLVGRAARHARRAGDDRRGTGVGLVDRVEIERARADLDEVAGAGEDRAVGGTLAAVAEAQGDRGAGVVRQDHVDRGAGEAAEREGVGSDAGVEDDAGGRHHVRDVDRAQGERVGVLQQDRAVDDGGRAGEGIGGAQGERAETHLGETAAEAFAAAARDGLVAQRAQQLDVVAIGIEHRVADHREAAGDGAEAGSDVDRRAGRPANGTAEDGEAARVGAVTGGDAAGEDLERAARVQDETALEGVAAGERDGGADDVDAVLVGAADGGSVVQGVAAAAEAVDAGDARSEGARVGDVAHARTESHARQVETGLGEIDIGGRRERRDRDGARAGGVGEAVDLGERGDGVADDRAGAGDDEEAAGLVGVEGRRVERATRGDGDRTCVDGDRGLEGVDATEGQDAQAVLDEAAGGVRRIEGADGDRRAGAAAAREGDGRDGARDVGAGAGDHDARDLAAADDGVAGSRGAARDEAGGAEGDERGADVAGAAGDGEVGLGHARAGGGGEAGEGDREAVGVDGQRAVGGSRAGDARVVDRAEEGVRPDAVGRHDAVVRGQDRAAGVAEE